MSHPIPPLSATKAHATTAPAKSADPAPKEVQRAAREFEAVFVRTMLEPLTKLGKLGGSQNAAGGQNAYSSMIVDALSDAISRAGGLGLSQLIERGLMQTASRKR